MQRVLLVCVLFAAAALAGCGDAPPSGEFATDRHNLMELGGNVEFVYQEEVRPAGGTEAETLVCYPSGVPNPSGQLQCIDAYTNVTGTFTGLPSPGSQGYHLWLAPAGGGNESLDVGMLQENATGGNGTFDLPLMMYDENMAGLYESAELRVGDVVVAKAGTGEGSNAVALEPMLVTVSATGAWKGKELTLTVTGTQPGVGYTGYLYVDEGAGPTQADSFPIDQGDGEYVFEASQNIGDYVEFHIHVAGTSVNVAQATV